MTPRPSVRQQRCIEDPRAALLVRIMALSAKSVSAFPDLRNPLLTSICESLPPQFALNHRAYDTVTCDSRVAKDQPHPPSWTSFEVLLYALEVSCGASSPPSSFPPRMKNTPACAISVHLAQHDPLIISQRRGPATFGPRRGKRSVPARGKRRQDALDDCPLPSGPHLTDSLL